MAEDMIVRRRRYNLTDEQVAYIRSRPKSVRAMAEELGVGRSAVWSAIKAKPPKAPPSFPPPSDGREWRQIPGFSIYYVSADGRVWSTRKGREMGLHLNHRGYMNVSLLPDGKSKTIYCKAHRLVALAFIPNPGGKAEVNHIDHDKTNNVVANLEWTTKRENIDHAIREGRYAAEIVCPWQKLTAEDEAAIRADTTSSCKDIAARYGVSASHISKVRKGNTRRARGETYASRPIPMSRACGPEDK